MTWNKVLNFCVSELGCLASAGGRWDLVSGLCHLSQGRTSKRWDEAPPGGASLPISWKWKHGRNSWDPMRYTVLTEQLELNVQLKTSEKSMKLNLLGSHFSFLTYLWSDQTIKQLNRIFH